MLCDPQFWRDFWANFLSDLLVGAVIGTIVGVVIARRSEKTQKERERQRRETRIRAILREELNSSKGVLAMTVTDLGGRDTGAFTEADDMALVSLTVPSASWSALLAGGELACIKDLDLLERLAITYWYIRLANRTLDAALVADVGRRAMLARRIFPKLAASAVKEIDKTLEML